jgi:hypothetical protein
MQTKWRTTAFAALLAAVLTASPAVLAAGAPAAQSQTKSQAQSQNQSQAKPMKLAGSVTAELKSAFVERGADRSTVGVVIWLRNEGTSVTRVPEYELRVTTGDGVAYTLMPSASNPRAIQAKGKAELGYLLEVERTDRLELAKLTWVDVDDYVYPRKETPLLSMNLKGKVWQSAAPDGGSAGVIPWGQPFKLEMYSADVTYTPASVQRQTTAQGGIVTVVTVRATNTGKQQAYVPDIAVSGSDGAKLYAGERADAKTTSLSPGESRNVRFAIPTPASASLTGFVVTTPERFTTAGGASITEHVGHVRIGLPPGGFSLAGFKNYVYGSPIELDSLNELVGKDVEVSLVELHMHGNQDDGYKTAVAKFKLRNNGKSPAPLPAFGAELMDADGYTYAGVRQIAAATSLMPGLSHVVSYSFNVPKTEPEDGRFALRLLEGGGTADQPYASPIAAIGVQAQNEDKDTDTWNLYPFRIQLKDWWLAAYADSVPVVSYSYKLRLNLDITREDDVVVDAGFSRLKFELVDTLGRMIGYETVPLTGQGRLVSGTQIVKFSNIRTEQQEYPLSINVYEVIDTPNGEASRLIRSFHQK